MLRAPCQLFTRLGDLFVVWLSVRGRQWVVTVASSGKPKETEEILRKKIDFSLLLLHILYFIIHGVQPR
jgi:hypothetical protein